MTFLGDEDNVHMNLKKKADIKKISKFVSFKRLKTKFLAL